MFARLRRWLFSFIERVNHWNVDHDLCELCDTDESQTNCITCGKRICYGCDSRYYDDVELCTECRKNITPKEEEDDRIDHANGLAEQCTCPKTMWTGSDLNDSTCELSEEEHEYIKKYAVNEEDNAEENTEKKK